MTENNEPFSSYEENKQLLDALFSEEKMRNYSKKEIRKYFDSIATRYQEIEQRYLRTHSTIQNIVADYLVSMGWNVQFETAFADFDYNLRFDIMAKRNGKTIVVEVKPEINREILGQLLEYIFSIEKKVRHGKFFLATDILNLPFIFKNGVLSEILIDFVSKHKMGFILVDSTKEGTETWLVPSEFILA